MKELIKQKLDEYIGFDSDKLFNDDYKNFDKGYFEYTGEKIKIIETKLIRIFGGAIRDIIAGDPINEL